MTLERRKFLKSIVCMGGATLLPWKVLASSKSRKYTNLKTDPFKILDLHPKFEYSIVQKIGDHMNDKLSAPGVPDGMGCFPGAGDQVILMRNHEISYYQWHLASGFCLNLLLHKYIMDYILIYVHIFFLSKIEQYHYFFLEQNFQNSNLDLIGYNLK